MFEDLCNFVKDLEKWERYQSLSFWGCTLGLYLSFSAGFDVLFPESITQFHVVIEQVQYVPKTNSIDIDGVILVNNTTGILPGADSFTITPSRRHPPGSPRMKGTNGIFAGPPKNINGHIPGRIPKVRPTDLNAKRGKNGDRCPGSPFNMEKEFLTFMDDMANKGIEVDCDQQRFNQLSVNPETGKIDEKSIFEAKGGLQGEGEKMYTNLARPSNPDVRLDFEAVNVETGERMFVGLKGQIDFQSLAEKGIDISHFQALKRFHIV